MADMRQTFVVYPPKSVSSLITHPPLVDVRVVTRLQTKHSRPMVQMRSVEHIMHVDVAPFSASVAHRGRARQVPDPGLETKLPLGERSNRTDVNHIAGIRIVEPLTGIESHLCPITAVENTELPG